MLIAQLKQHVESSADVITGKPYYCNLNCDLSWIFVPESTERQMFYLACEVCKKKVIPTGANYHCESCSRSFENAVPTYNFSIRVSDCSGTLMVSCFGEIGETILGINAKSFYAIHEDTAKVKDLTMDVLHKLPLNLVVRAKADPERFNPEGPQVRYTAVRAAKHSFAEANQILLAMLKAYGEMPEPMATDAPEVNFF